MSEYIKQEIVEKISSEYVMEKFKKRDVTTEADVVKDTTTACVALGLIESICAISEKKNINPAEVVKLIPEFVLKLKLMERT